MSLCKAWCHRFSVRDFFKKGVFSSQTVCDAEFSGQSGWSYESPVQKGTQTRSKEHADVDHGTPTGGYCHDQESRIPVPAGPEEGQGREEEGRQDRRRHDPERDVARSTA